MNRKIKFICVILSIFVFIIFSNILKQSRAKLDTGFTEPTASGAWYAFQWWYSQRAYPYDLIPKGSFEKASKYVKQTLNKGKSISDVTPNPWISLGPTNIGGRVLALAVDPSNPNIIWAGSASGGLWKSTTAGEGTNAWSYVNTGFNAISVSAIALDPIDPDIIYIGTGEISHYRRPLVGTPGARASYGMGILKSTDGGVSWNQTGLTWTFPEITAVQKIIINPQNRSVIFAATSEGVFKSQDGGTTWIQTPTPVMAMDVIMSPADTSTLFSAHGNLNSSPVPGVYKTTNSGYTWTRLSGGLPTVNFGRTSLSISSSAPYTIYAGIADAVTSQTLGLYKSTDNGNTWSLINTQNYVGSQGWYDNVIAVHPQSPDTIYCAGLNIHKSIDGGINLPEISGGAVHVDHHAIVFHPSNPRIVYFGTDGGVYKTTNGGNSFIDCNNGFITTQFYPGFANSFTDTSISIGGLQDNGTLKFSGSLNWTQIFGADGGWCAIDPTNPNILYFEYQWLNMYKSTNGGITSFRITDGLPTGSSNTNFIPPFVLSPSNPQILYAGSNNVYKSTSGGSIWFPSNGETTLNGTNIACIAVSYTSHDSLIAGTGTGALGATPKFEIFTSVNGGLSWINVTYRLNGTDSLPNRYPTDIEFNPNNSKIAYLTYSGYGTSHVFMTQNFGLSWIDISGNLPDIPHQAVVVDPEATENIYVGTDLGVFHSSTGGSIWEDYNSGIPPAMVLDLTISRNNGKIRASTFGNGIYERPLFRIPALTLLIPDGGEVWAGGFPETIVWSQKFLNSVRIEFSTDNGLNWNLIADSIPAKNGSYIWDLPLISTSEAKVKISNTNSPSLSDSSESSFTILLNPDYLSDWNLISVPYKVADSRTTSLYPSAISEAFSYNGTYAQVESLRTGEGYWLKFAIPQFITFVGDSLKTDTVYVIKGWNIIGALTDPINIANIFEEPEGIITSDIFGYRQGYLITDTLHPKYGYWVKVNSSGKLILSSNQNFKTHKWISTSDIKLKNRFPENYLSFRDKKGNQQKLYFSINDLDDFKQCELPPPPPPDVLDVRFIDGTMIGNLSTRKEIPISIRTEYLPVAIEWNINCSDVEIFLKVNDYNYRLSKSGQISIHEKINFLSLNRGTVEGSTEPLTFFLEQNYPNPFNPTTKIFFGIDKRALVSLKIYDTIGREVAILINRIMEPGNYETYFDGSNLPGGIYFCKIQAEQKSITKKMMLVK